MAVWGRALEAQPSGRCGRRVRRAEQIRLAMRPHHERALWPLRCFHLSSRLGWGPTGAFEQPSDLDHSHWKSFTPLWCGRQTDVGRVGWEGWRMRDQEEAPGVAARWGDSGVRVWTELLEELTCTNSAGPSEVAPGSGHVDLRI